MLLVDPRLKNFRVFVWRALVSLLGAGTFGWILAQAKPILDYPVFDAKAGSASLAPPVSAFHDWQVAELEAAKIADAWVNSPVTVPWTRLQLERHITHKTSPTRAARGLALTYVAMHDAYELALQNNLEPKLAVSMAAALVLSYLYSSEERAFDRIVYSLAARIGQTSRENFAADSLQSMLLGKVVGERVVQRAESDGAQRGWNGMRLQFYGDGRYYGPGTWEPTPPYFYYPPDEPFAPTWTPWVLRSASQFRPTPPGYGSERFVRDLREVVATIKNLSANQLRIAKFWVDGSGSVTPPGHWNQIALTETLAAKLGDAETARLFAELNIALADTFIATWDAKYRYWTVRPITAAKRLLGIELKLPILTPPFPSYVSGHAAFSGAAARILSSFFPKSSVRLNAMAEEAALSRMLGGIHYRFDNEDGLALGRSVADFVLHESASR